MVLTRGMYDGLVSIAIDRSFDVVSEDAMSETKTHAIEQTRATIDFASRFPPRHLET